MFWTIGCIYGASSVAFGAFGAHGLKKHISDPARLANWSTAAQYQLIHSGVLLLTAAAAPKNKVIPAFFVLSESFILSGPTGCGCTLHGWDDDV
ncbi:uncharacterized protein Z520_00442 [Fonsecaea multimorphosa CBS 102226]|uniref:DUF423-domain-containing protein n=1 Tax=Fonsecaea multimorphosa CBS 102226 TaxID=1442371 RepID=A0A0D2HPI8_9EURO|nr:uncharacterized protein Z520_00442 [Fonsecaea multimorphosa CBS 102226]KIY03751.1 hypothetical protein Z520_00442 [Fonsecaea multimorphosa CBS 102226]